MSYKKDQLVCCSSCGKELKIGGVEAWVGSCKGLCTDNALLRSRIVYLRLKLKINGIEPCL